MKKANVLFRFLVTGLAIAPSLAHAGKVLVLPLNIDTTRIHDHKVVQDFYYEAVDQANGGQVTRAKADEACSEKECAMAKAKTAQVDQVLFGVVRFLGRKCYFTSTIMGPNGENAFSQTINLAGVADFEAGTKRMADAMIHRAKIENVATIDNITDNENEQALLASRRHSFYSIGGSIGYMYPLGNSYQRWAVDNTYGYYCSDVLDTTSYCRAKKESYKQMVVLAWDNWFEFRPELAMEVNVLWIVPLSVGLDIDMDYLIGKGDFTPFVGGGLGLHYVGADEGSYKDDSKRNSGPTLDVQGGMILFRTYTVNLIVKGSYHVVLNTDYDNGVGFELGIRTKF